MVDFLIEKHNYNHASQVKINDPALQALRSYTFPGNVRELENILERALALCENETIEIDDLQLPEIAASAENKQQSLGEMTENLEKAHIMSALEDHRWNQSATARTLGLTLRQLRYRIDKLKLKKV
ncbi:MAG: hypothetical protein [Olavius algarvensis Gamma 3 endosymbiont]|nr:MAG: hypothetical protein [Olavius algarvensis Gamma 3 endosymbiont]